VEIDNRIVEEDDPVSKNFLFFYFRR